MTNTRIIYLFVMLYFILIVLNSFGLNVWLPGCPIKYFTGVECFGCGLNRAAIAMVQLNFKEALAQNPLIFVYTFIFIILTGRDIYKSAIIDKP